MKERLWATRIPRQMGRKSLAAAQLAFPSATSSLAAPSLFSLQRTIGNRATQKLLTRPLRRNRRAGTLNNYSDQRADYDLEPMLLPWRSRFRLMKVSAADAKIQYKKLTEEEKAADLQSDPLKHDARLQTAFDNSPLMTTGERSEGVKTLQRALRDLGYPMAVSFAKTGDADGIFGSETYKAVYQFQVDHTLQYKDGIVGRETLLTLDQLLLGQQTPCNINYAPGPLGYQERKAFVEKNFSLSDRSGARKILDDLCQVAQGTLSFESEQELRDEIFKRLKVSQYMQESQTTESFEYPEAATDCPGKTGNALANAQVNKAAKDYWKGPILEQRPKVKNRHYYFELTEDKGKNAGYDALKLLFTPQSNICDRTLIHCDSLITLAKMLAYADTIGQESFDAKIKSGTLQMWLTYDGMSAVENGKSTTPVTEAYFSFEPANEEDLVIGDHVVFWNHLAYDAISLRNPGPWRLENALLVDKDASGNDLFEGHGAPSVGGTVKPGTKEDILKDLMNTFNAYAKDALELTARVDANEAGAEEELAYQYPWVTKINGVWYVEEIPRNKDRPIHFYPLREITDVNDPELIGLHNPYAPAKLSPVMRPIESK